MRKTMSCLRGEPGALRPSSLATSSSSSRVLVSSSTRFKGDSGRGSSNSAVVSISAVSEFCGPPRTQARLRATVQKWGDGIKIHHTSKTRKAATALTGPSSQQSCLDLRGLAGVLLELLYARVGQGVLEHRLEYGVGHGGDVGTGLGRLHDVQGMAEAGGQHLSGQVVAVEYLDDLPHYRHPLLADVVQPPDEGADVGGAGLGRQERLVRLEDKGGVDLDPLLGGAVDRLQAVLVQGDLDHDIRVPLGDVPRLFHEPIGVPGQALRRHGAIDDGAYFEDDVAVVGAGGGLGPEGGVGGDAADHGEPGGGGALVYAGRVQPELHLSVLL